jgi:hypothetical protein
MSTRRSNIRKRGRQRKRYAQRPKPVDKPAVSSSRGLLSELAQPLSAIAFSEALKETQTTRV